LGTAGTGAIYGAAKRGRRMNDGAWTIRRAAPEDAARLAELANALDFEDLGEQALRPFDASVMIRDFICENAILATEVAVAGGIVVGYAAHNLAYHAETARPARWLENLYVTPEWRGGGVARALMAAVSRHALATGCDAVFWGVRRDNAGGRRFYDKLGAGDEAADIRLLCGDALEGLAGES
jgi:GNAT superfamily N-acetyltransferase